MATPANKMAAPGRNRRSCAEEMAAGGGQPVPPAGGRGGRLASPDQEHDFLEEPPQDYYCAVSLELLLEPYQTGCCGHHLLREVVERLQRDGKPCPMCNRPNFPTNPDIYLRRKVRELKVRCPYIAGGCVWIGELSNKVAHTRTCPKQPWSCPHCQFAGLREVSREHTEGCEQVPVACPNNCDIRQVSRCQLSAHLDKDCPLQPVACTYSHVGCTQPLVRSELPGHIQNMHMYHMMLMCSVNLDLTRQLNEKLTEKDTQIEALRGDVARLEQELGQRVQAVEAGVAAQTEWMESNQRQEEEKEGEGEERGLLTEETLRTVVGGLVGEMEERVLRELKKEVEGVRGAVDENYELTVQEMREKQDEALGKVGWKLEEVFKQVEQDREVAEEHFKGLETAMKKERELVAKTTEEMMRRVSGEVERGVVEEVKKSIKEVEGFVIRELVKEAGKREEVRREMGAVGERVRGVEAQIKTSEGKLMTEMSAVKTYREKKIEETRVGITGEEEVVPVSSEPTRQHKGKGKASASSSRPRFVASEDAGPLSSWVKPLSSAATPGKQMSEEDANRKPKPTASGVPHSMPELEASDGLALDPALGEQRILPPCQFEIRNFSVLREANKEWRSSPFYSRDGYKMCLGVWPNGFRSGAGTHVSVEFYKMKDTNTDKLKWNVKLPIHVRIYNYRTKAMEREHVNGETFTRSKVSGEFETSGYAQSHKLVAHDDLEPYLRYNTFIIQVYKFELKP